MTLIAIAGDWHGNIQHVEDLMVHLRFKYQRLTRIVQCGDFGYWPHKDKFHEEVGQLAYELGFEVYFIDGNHENFDALELVEYPYQVAQRVFYLPRGSRWKWGSTTFLGLGGGYSIDKHYRVQGVSWWPQELITQRQALHAAKQGTHAHVMICHDAPLSVKLPVNFYKNDNETRANRQLVQLVVDDVKPWFVYHGHYHYRYTGSDHNATPVVGLADDRCDLPYTYVVFDVLETKGVAPR